MAQLRREGDETAAPWEMRGARGEGGGFTGSAAIGGDLIGLEELVDRLPIFEGMSKYLPLEDRWHREIASRIPVCCTAGRGTAARKTGALWGRILGRGERCAFRLLIWI